MKKKDVITHLALAYACLNFTYESTGKYGKQVKIIESILDKHKYLMKRIVVRLDKLAHTKLLDIPMSIGYSVILDNLVASYVNMGSYYPNDAKKLESVTNMLHMYWNSKVTEETLDNAMDLTDKIFLHLG